MSFSLFKNFLKFSYLSRTFSPGLWIDCVEMMSLETKTTNILQKGVFKKTMGCLVLIAIEKIIQISICDKNL